MICDEVWSDEWFCSLPQREKLLYLYLLGTCSKCGIFELNMRKMNFDLTNGTEDVPPYTVDEVMSFGGDRIKRLGDSRAIITGYIAVNWTRGKPLDPVKNPLHRGLMQELAKYGLTFADVNAVSKKKFTWMSDNEIEAREVREEAQREIEENKLKSVPNAVEWFEMFWKAYPATCPRKVDKKKCMAKYATLLKNAGQGADHLHEKIMAGLGLWVQSEMWNNDGGKYIKAPLVWLNGSCWEDTPMKGNGNGNGNRQGTRGSDNSFTSGKSDITNLF